MVERVLDMGDDGISVFADTIEKALIIYNKLAGLGHKDQNVRFPLDHLDETQYAKSLRDVAVRVEVMFGYERKPRDTEPFLLRSPFYPGRHGAHDELNQQFVYFTLTRDSQNEVSFGVKLEGRAQQPVTDKQTDLAARIVKEWAEAGLPVNDQK